MFYLKLLLCPYILRNNTAFLNYIFKVLPADVVIQDTTIQITPRKKEVKSSHVSSIPGLVFADEVQDAKIQIKPRKKEVESSHNSLGIPGLVFIDDVQGTKKKKTRRKERIKSEKIPGLCFTDM